MDKLTKLIEDAEKAASKVPFFTHRHSEEWKTHLWNTQPHKILPILRAFQSVYELAAEFEKTGSYLDSSANDAVFADMAARMRSAIDNL